MRLAYDAGEIGRDETLKNIYLRGLNKSLRTAMVPVEVGRDWTIQRLMSRVTSVEENLFRSKLNAPPGPRGRNKSNNNTPPAPPQGDQMDWAPTPAHAGTMSGERKRATWVKKETVLARVRAKQCVRCGKPGHFSNQCHLLPPERPASAKTSSVEGEEEKEKEEEYETADEAEN